MHDIIEISEQVKDRLAISSLADNVGIGIEYYLRGDMDKAKKLLKCGIILCEKLEKGSKLYKKKKINGSQYNDLAIFDAYISSKKISEEGPTAEIEKIEDAKRVIKGMMEGKEYKEEKAREIQKFFILVGVDPLKQAFDELEKINAEIIV